MAQLRTVKGPDACWVSGPFCFAVGCVRHWLANLLFNRFNALCFFAYVRVWRCLAWVYHHTFYIMVYLCVFRYRL